MAWCLSRVSCLLDQGRSVHIHFKIRTPAPGGETCEFTSQLWLDDSLVDEILGQLPYSAKARQRDTTDATDGIDMHLAN
jgi:hypothetical protein